MGVGSIENKEVGSANEISVRVGTAMGYVSVLRVRRVNDAHSVCFNSIAIGFAGMIEFESRDAASANFDQVSRGVLFKSDAGTERLKVNGEKGRLHLVAKSIFDAVMTTVDNDFVSFLVSRREERYALNVIIMKVGKEKMESLVG